MSLILSCLGEALEQIAPEDLLDGILQRRSKVAQSWWRRLGRAHVTPDAIPSELRRVGAFTPREAADVCRGLAGEISTPALRDAVGRCLAQVVALSRRQFRLAGDKPLVVDDSTSLLPFLPTHLAAFSPGARPPWLGDLELGEFRGGSRHSEVYEASNPHLPAAPPSIVKISLHADGRRMLRHEALMSDMIRSRGCKRGVLPVRHTFLSGEVPALVYPAVDGFDLHELLSSLHRRHCYPHPRWVAELMHRTALILKPIHAGFVVHRDIKLSNIMIGKVEGGPREMLLIDCGISGPAGNFPPEDWPIGVETRNFSEKLLIYGRSEVYASPSQQRMDLSLPRDDVYSLGVVVIHALTGDFRRVDDTPWQQALQERGVPPKFVELLAECVAVEERHRPADGNQLAARLEEVIHQAAW
jgi:hypothetical protein